MAVLYFNSAGRAVTKSSFSSNQVFNSCRRKYYLGKVAGWRKRDRSAAMEFGKAVENSIQYFHENGLSPGSGAERFRLEWGERRTDTELIYKPTEGDFENLLRAGTELLQLYEVILPTLPLTNPVFQANYCKTVFPGTELEEIEHQGYLDMVVPNVPWSHPLLPTVPASTEPRRLLVDIKTAGKMLSITREMLNLEPQLRSYSWLSGVRDVAFLWATKSIWNAYRKGVEVTFLTSSDNWTAGDRAVVFEYDVENGTVLLTTQEGLQRIKALLDEIKGKGSTERKETLIAGLVSDNDLLSASVDDITKQRIQFLATRLTEEDVWEAGEQIGQEIAAIHNANEKNVWLPSPGVKFPDTKCLWCEFRGNCTKNDALRDSLVTRITPADDVFYDIEEDYEEDFGFGE